MSIEDTKNPRSAIRGFFYAYNASTKARPVASLLPIQPFANTGGYYTCQDRK